MRPATSEYGPFFAGYVGLVPETDIVLVLQSQLADVTRFWNTIPESQATAVHAPYTWSVRQVLDHLVDGERIFGYRLLRISRGDTTPLPGFDENFYATASEESATPLTDIIEAFDGLRRANLVLIRNLPESAWDRTGTTGGTPITARALAWILAGHIRHHDAILRRRLS